MDAALATEADRAEVLDELTRLIASQGVPVQVCHGPSRAEPATPTDRFGGFAALLAHTARPRATTFAAAEQCNDAVPHRLRPLPAVAAERPDRLELADGRLGAVLYLSRWPAAVPVDWLHEVCAERAIGAVTVHVQPVAPQTAARLVSRRLSVLSAGALLDGRTGRLTDPAVSAGREAADRLAGRLARGETALCHAQLLFGLLAGSHAALHEAVQSVQQRLAAHLAVARSLRCAQLPGWRALVPGGPAVGRPPGVEWRLLDAASCAATVPWPASPVGADRGGALVGLHPPTGCPLRVDRFAAVNPNRLVVGTSGAGKSFAAKLELLRWRRAGVPAMVIDPEGEFGAVAKSAGGRVLRVGEEPAPLDRAELTVFDLRSVPPRARPAVTADVLGAAWSRAATGDAPLLVVVDEAHLLLSDPVAADLLAEFTRRARKYRVGLELVTQRLSDFLLHPAGEAVLANTACKLLLGCEPHERSAVQRGLGLSDPESYWLRPGRAGRGLLLTSTARTPVQVTASPGEHRLAGSGPRRLGRPG